MEINKLKQQVTRIYNDINRELFSAGVQSLQITTAGNKIIILAEHQRIPALKALDVDYRHKTKDIDVLLGDIFKQRFKAELTARLALDIQQVFRDYDPVDEAVATLIILKKCIV